MKLGNGYNEWLISPTFVYGSEVFHILKKKSEHRNIQREEEEENGMRDLDTKMTYLFYCIMKEKDVKSFYFRKIGNEVTCWVGGVRKKAFRGLK